MSERKWTKGPWVWQSEDECLVGPEQVVMRQDECGMKNFAQYGDGTEQANAHLIAAAPDLYEALEALLSELVLTVHSSSLNPEIRDCLAALAKARGEK